MEAFSAAAVCTNWWKLFRHHRCLGFDQVIHRAYSFLVPVTCLSSHSVTWVIQAVLYMCRVLPEYQVTLWYWIFYPYTFSLPGWVLTKQWYSRIVVGLVHVVRHFNRNNDFFFLFLWKIPGLYWAPVWNIFCSGVVWVFVQALSLYTAIIAICLAQYMLRIRWMQ